jgi:hypothetical protein
MDRLFGDVKRHYWQRLLWPMLRQVIAEFGEALELIDPVRKPRPKRGKQVA